MPKDKNVNIGHEISFSLTDANRKALRDKVVNKFLEEEGGYWKDGKKHVMCYVYYVEKLMDGRRIYLYRPTFLNKGIDFQVIVERYTKNGDARPSHKDMLKDLKIKKTKNPELYQKLIAAIERVWNCEEPDAVLRDIGTLEFRAGHSVELLLKSLKWLFIEQDITYWNYVGRGMLLAAIKSV